MDKTALIKTIAAEAQRLDGDRSPAGLNIAAVEELNNIKVGTVDGLIGAENNVVTTHLVSGGDSPGFVSVSHRLIVAASRAKHLQIFTGNMDFLEHTNLQPQHDTFAWNKFLELTKMRAIEWPARRYVGFRVSTILPKRQILQERQLTDAELARPMLRSGQILWRRWRAERRMGTWKKRWQGWMSTVFTTPD